MNLMKAYKKCLYIGHLFLRHPFLQLIKYAHVISKKKKVCSCNKNSMHCIYGECILETNLYL